MRVARVIATVATVGLAGIWLKNLTSVNPSAAPHVVAAAPELLAVQRPSSVALWTRRLDTSTRLYKADFWEPAIAIGGGRIVFRSGGHMCGFHVADGRQLWCAGEGDHPVFGSDRFVYITGNNDLQAVDARSGTPQWSFRFQRDPQLTLPGARSFVWAFSDIFIAASYARVDASSVPYAALNARGRTLWTASDQDAVHGPLVRLDARNVLIPQQGSGAYLVTPWKLVQLKPISYFGPSFSSATAFLGRHGGLVFADPNSLASVDERLRSFRVRVDDESGAILQDETYRPRLVAPQSEICPIICEGDAVAFDDRFVYGRIHDVLYRLPWKDGGPNASVSLGEARSFEGRTLGGSMIITRADGTWLIDTIPHSGRARRLASENVVVLHRSLPDLDVLGFGSGDVIALARREKMVAWRSSCPLVDAAREGTVLLLACGGPRSRVEAVAIESAGTARHRSLDWPGPRTR